ncbi:MAG: hypothetical protein AB9M53_08260 [Leptothrix sp. (in: b-proteobacteria)]
MGESAVHAGLLPERIFMDFIERIFGFSPDGGSGAFEFLLFLIPIVGIVWLHWRRRRRNRPIDRNDKG